MFSNEIPRENTRHNRKSQQQRKKKAKIDATMSSDTAAASDDDAPSPSMLAMSLRLMTKTGNRKFQSGSGCVTRQRVISLLEVSTSRTKLSVKVTLRTQTTKTAHERARACKAPLLACREQSNVRDDAGVAACNER